MNRSVAVVLAAGLLASCSATTTGGGAASSEATSSTAAVTTSTSSTSTTTTLPPTTTSTIPGFLGEEVIGTSVQGRPITAFHRGTPGGIPILLVGVIHGNETDGLAILDVLRTAPLPDGYDLWIMPALNPDGQAAGIRQNANGVDLNRNFPNGWGPIGGPGDSQYSGPSAGSEPETQAFMAFTQRLQPRLTIWYHQNSNLIQPSQRADGPLRKRYAELTGLPYKALTGTGSTFSGIAATWVRQSVPNAMSFIVELGDTVTPEQAQVHANAVVDVMRMVTG